MAHGGYTTRHEHLQVGPSQQAEAALRARRSAPACLTVRLVQASSCSFSDGAGMLEQRARRHQALEVRVGGCLVERVLEPVAAVVAIAEHLYPRFRQELNWQSYSLERACSQAPIISRAAAPAPQTIRQ